MRIRSNIFPKRLRDWGLFLMIVICVPFVYLVEVTVVLPYFHGPETVMHSVHFFLALFVVTNISCNFLAIILLDTSVPKEIMSAEPKPKWDFCSQCTKYVPPRSWHCKTCDVCILKRDHHCLFAGCCVGHYNIRYFILFLIYMCFSCLYALTYNGVFLYWNVSFRSLGSLVKLICPACMVFFDIETSSNHSYILTFSLTLVGFTLSSILLSHHLQMVFSGKVTHERNNNYNLGWRKNIECALGKKWYLTWIFPLISSPLPNNGIDWITASEWEQTNKQNLVKDK